VKVVNEKFDYAYSPTNLFSLIGNGSFQLEIIVHLGGRDPELVDEAVTDEGGVKLVTRQRTGIELPGFAKRLVPANTTVLQTYLWGPPDEDGFRKGTWSADAKGAPVSVGGSTEIRSTASGSCHVYTGEVRASVPLVGGKLESFALDNLQRELARAADFTAVRLAAEYGGSST
jgi:hypothetical protein